MFENMDWELLRQQKMTLLHMLEPYQNILLTDEEFEDLQGILHLIDAVQDHAVDVLGLDENIVFNLTND